MIVTIHFPNDKHPPFELDILSIPENKNLFYIDNSIPGSLGSKYPYYVKNVEYFVNQDYTISIHIKLDTAYVSMCN